MPDPNKADFEAKAVLDPQDFSIRQNESQASAQANETFVFDAADGKVLGDTGETLGFAKKAATYDPAVAKARQKALDQANADKQAMLNDPAKPHVRTWSNQREMLQSLPFTLEQAKDALISDMEFLARFQADESTDPARVANFEKKVREGPAEIARLEQLTKDAPQIKAALIAQLQTDKDIQALVQQEQKIEAAKAVNSSYNIVAGASSNLYASGDAMSSPRKGGDRQLISRSVASYEVDRLIGTGVIAQEKYVLDEKNKLMGVSIQCDGAGVRSQPGTTDEWGRPQTAFLNIKYSAPAIQKGLCDLEAMDYITGQIDRHPGNIFIDPKSGKVTGIDNDLAFPELDREDMLDRHGGELKTKAVAGMPRVMHTETAAKLMAVSPEDLRTTLKNTRPPDSSNGLGDQEIEGAVARLQNLQAAIRNPDSVPVGFKLVVQFDEGTYAEAVAVHEAQKANPSEYEATHTTSYLSSILTEKKDIKQKMAEGNTQNVLRDAKSVDPARRNEQYAEYAKQAEIAKQTFKANPQIIPNLTDRQQVVDLKQQIAEAKAKIGEHNARLDKLENPGVRDRLVALRHGGVDGARDVVAAKKEQAQQRVASLERQLDKAVEKSIPLDLKNGLYQDAGLELARKQQQVQTQSVSPRAAAGNPPIEARVPLQDLPPPTSKVGVAVNALPPIEQRVPVNDLPSVDGSPSKVAKKNIPAKTDETGVAERASHANDGLEAQAPLEADSLNVKPESMAPTAELPTLGVESSSSAQTQAPRKNSAADALKRSNSLPDLNTLRQGKALDSEGPEAKMPEVKRDNSLRASGDWKSAKTSSPPLSVGSLKTSHP
jgi:hypothetical protein